MKITQNLHLLRIDFEIPITPEKKLPRFVNILLILDDTITLIDTGVKGSEKIISGYLKQQGRDISEVSAVILSHSHPDHIGSAARIKELTGCKIFAHQLESEWIENIDLQNKLRPVPGFYDLVDHPVKIDEFLRGNQEFNAGKDITLRIIESPGHSKGSVNILFEQDKILFTADSIPLKNDIPNYDNFRDLMRSLSKIRDNQEYNILLSSWTSPLTGKDEIEKIISEGEEYMLKLDSVVKACYSKENQNSMEPCKAAVEKLGLPPFLANPIVDRAFKSHME